MAYRVRLGVLLGMLALSLVAFYYREPIRGWLRGERALAARFESHPAPELPPLRALSGPEVRLAALRGRVVLLHFWTFG